MKTQFDNSQVILLKWNFVYNLAIAVLVAGCFLALHSPWVFLLLILCILPKTHQEKNDEKET